MKSFFNQILDSNIKLTTNQIDPSFSIAFGIIFIVLGLSFFGLFPYTKRKGNLYKQKQLDLYKQKYNFSNARYEDTNMNLPPWEKAKVFYPLFFGLLFIIIGISFLLKTQF